MFFDDDDDEEELGEDAVSAPSVVRAKIAIASASCRTSDNWVTNLIIAASPNSTKRCVKESTTRRTDPPLAAASFLLLLDFFNASIVSTKLESA
jgi:hypothetical protein